MLKRILAAVDQSPRSHDVVLATAQLARLSASCVQLYRAIVVPPDFPAAAANTLDPLPDFLEAESKRDLQALIAPFPDVSWDAVVERSPTAWRAILAAADAFEADLIVVGSHGYDMLDRVLGTTAARIANCSQRDVYVVHRSSERCV